MPIIVKPNIESESRDFILNYLNNWLQSGAEEGGSKGATLFEASATCDRSVAKLEV